MGLGNLAPYFSGIALIIIGLYGITKSYWEWKDHDEPVKRLAFTLMVSFALFGIIGGIAVFLTILVTPQFWALQAIVVTTGYLILAHESLSMLEKLRKPEKKHERKKVKCALPVAGIVKSREEAVILLKAVSNYADLPLLVIGREHPEEWTNKTGIEPDDYIWLTRVEHKKAVSPSSLHVLSGKVIGFIRDNPGGVIYIEGIEYMLFYSDFKAVAKFLFSIRDAAMIESAHVLILANEDTLSPEQMAILKKEFEEIDVEKILEKLMGPALFGAIPSRKRRDFNASAEGSEEGSGAGEEKAEEARPLRREETAEEGR
ncbi:DUF835 domain-containing protein [Thermococcus henrietii]|uniref:DUF835 domain-containing protein n=1 Tax=Thermococcus henrietii TaxID=2016361 RepID=UPI000C074EA5|nr:DUF835 domain-containing protein [Thermococcus henrietii]